MQGLKILFAGTPEFAAHYLQILLDAGHQVVAVYTQPDRPAGRGRKLTPGPVKQLALQHGLAVLQPRSLKDSETQQALAEWNADVMVVVAYGLILPAPVLEIPRLGCINVHASILPRWRGAAPIQRAILAGDAETGVTIMQMDPGLDTGDMLKVVACPIEADETAQSLHDKLARLGGPALLETLTELANGQTRPVSQDDSQATYAEKLHKQDAELDWTRPALVLERQVRAFNPWPVATSLITNPAGEERPPQKLRIWQAQALNQACSQEPGQVLEESAQGIDVATGEGVLRLTRVQLPGGKVLDVREFINAHSLLGCVLS